MKTTKKKKAGAKEKTGVTVKVNKALNKYDNKVLFPEKLAKANQMIKKLNLKPL